METKKFKVSFNSPVILVFAGVCFVATVLNYMTRGASNKLLFMTYHSSLTKFGTYIRFFTHIFGHADWNHFVGNMVYILLLGPLLEEKYGSVRIVEIILITALVTGIMNYIFFWNVALCGASGVCFAFILLSSFTGFKDREIPITFILVAVFFIGQQLMDGIFVRDNISNVSHVLGGVVGSVFGFMSCKKSTEVTDELYR